MARQEEKRQEINYKLDKELSKQAQDKILEILNNEGAKDIHICWVTRIIDDED